MGDHENRQSPATNQTPPRIRTLMLEQLRVQMEGADSWLSLIEQGREFLDDVDVLIGVSPFVGFVPATKAELLEDCPEVVRPGFVNDPCEPPSEEISLAFLRHRALNDWLSTGAHTLVLLPVLEATLEEVPCPEIPEGCRTERAWHRDAELQEWLRDVIEAPLEIEERSTARSPVGATRKQLGALGELWAEELAKYSAPNAIRRQVSAAHAAVSVEVWQIAPGSSMWRGHVATGRVGQGAFLICQLLRTPQERRLEWPVFREVEGQPREPTPPQIADTLVPRIVEMARRFHRSVHGDVPSRVDPQQMRPRHEVDPKPETPASRPSTESNKTPTSRGKWTFSPEGDDKPTCVEIPGVGRVDVEPRVGALLRKLWDAEGRIVKAEDLNEALGHRAEDDLKPVHKAKSAATKALKDAGISEAWINDHLKTHRSKGYRLERP